MGYYAHSTDSKIVIRKRNIKALVDAYNRGMKESGYRDLDVFEAFAEEGFQVDELWCKDSSGTPVPSGDISFWFEHNKWYTDEIESFFNIIAPYVEAGSYIAFQGEDDSVWAYYFDGRKCEEYWGMVVFPGMPDDSGQMYLSDSDSAEKNLEHIFGKDLARELPHDLYSRIEDKISQGKTVTQAISQSLFDIITAKSPEESFMSQDALSAICGGGS